MENRFALGVVGRWIFIKAILYEEEYGTLGKLVRDVAHYYTEGRKILDRLVVLERERG